MRTIHAALVVSALCASPLGARELPQFADAALHAVQFVDENEGWAVGDDGVILHTIDGGQTWERQPSGVRASLRSICFLDPFTGYAAGREGLPYNAGAAGVILFTNDGGVKWQRVSVNELPGLNRVKFLNPKLGFVVGDGTNLTPTGVFCTEDSGATWEPLPGARAPGWLAADFSDGDIGVLGGSWGSLAPIRGKSLVAAEVDGLDGRNVRAVQLQGRAAWAAGDGGLVLHSADTAGRRWGFLDLQLPVEVQRSWDFHALQFVGEHGWLAGRPGSVVLHTWDRGKSWQVQNTGQTMPLHGLYFVNERRGWAVGDMGTILTTADGGKKWQVQRRGGHRAAVLLLTSRPAHLQPGAIALLTGGDQGYLTAAVSITCSDPASADPAQAAEGTRFHEAVRSTGGLAGELLWQFPLPGHLAQANVADLAKFWGKSQDEARGLEELERQMVLALRLWRPDVVITDHPDPRSSTGHPGALVALLAKKAFERAGQADAYPEQIAKLDLQPWEAKKLYGRWDGAEGAQVALDLDLASMELEGTANDFALRCWSLLQEKPTTPPTQAYYRLLASRLEKAEAQRWLMQGCDLGQGGQARRAAATVDPDRESRWGQIQNAAKQRRDFQAIARQSLADTPLARQLLATLEQSVAGLTEDQAGDAAFAMGHLYANAGQWLMAKEVFVFMLDRYPTHRQGPGACRWLIRHGASSEARRREELNHFIATRAYEFLANPLRVKSLAPDADRKPSDLMTVRRRRDSALLRRSEDVKEWYKRSLAVGDVLTSFGPLYFAEPQTQFCLQSAKRNLGQFDDARLWYTQFKTNQQSGPWFDAAATELWLLNRQGMPAKPVTPCAFADVPPYLDGRLDDPCWRSAKPVLLKNAVGQTAERYAAEAWLTYDSNYLYLAIRCQHPDDGHQVPAVKPRSRDADLRAFDRVSLTLDLDRDYSTYYHFQVDQRGCVFEDCWGDRTWDPKWYVAVHSEPTVWQIEAAIPLHELSAEGVKVGQCWACNVVRTLPGKGVQSFSLPADAVGRAEGMGLLQFVEPDNGRGPSPKKMTTAENRP